MSSNPITLLTPEEYLSIERKAEYRSEYYAGEMFAMAGATRRHNRIVTNLSTALDNQLKSRPCNVYTTDMRVRVPATGLYTYPDVVVTCGEEVFDDEESDVLLNPLVIIEVLSDSTEAYDRGKKFEHYRTISSLTTFILVNQQSPKVEPYVRQEDGKRWTYSETHEVGETVIVEAIACELKLEDIYAKVG